MTDETEVVFLDDIYALITNTAEDLLTHIQHIQASIPRAFDVPELVTLKRVAAGETVPAEMVLQANNRIGGILADHLNDVARYLETVAQRMGRNVPDGPLH